MENIDKITLECLEKYRNESGFIDMDEFLKENPRELKREMVGSKDREKDWIDFDDETRALLKTENESLLEGENGALYADLIISKLAKQAGFESAHQDLIIYKGKKGILSKDVKQKGESFRTLRDYIGDDPLSSRGYEDTTDLEYVHDKLFNALSDSDISTQNIKDIINRFNKLLVFDIFTMSTDNHTENIAFLESIDKSGKKTIRLSPIFDRENSLALDIPFEDMEKISNDYSKLANVVKMQDPKIAIIPNKDDEEGELSPFFSILKSQVEEENMSEITLDYLCDFTNINEFITGTCMNLDITKAIDEVEKDIKAKLPECVKDMAINAFEDRKEQMKVYLGLDLDEIEQEKEKCTKDKQEIEEI